jgi:hypothetical protein
MTGAILGKLPCVVFLLESDLIALEIQLQSNYNICSWGAPDWQAGRSGLSGYFQLAGLTLSGLVAHSTQARNAYVPAQVLLP